MVGVLVRYWSDYSNIRIFTPLDVKGELVAVRVALHRSYPTKKEHPLKNSIPSLSMSSVISFFFCERGGALMLSSCLPWTFNIFKLHPSNSGNSTSWLSTRGLKSAEDLWGAKVVEQFICYFICINLSGLTFHQYPSIPSGIKDLSTLSLCFWKLFWRSHVQKDNTSLWSLCPSKRWRDAC